jgi:tetratricopeptide (TPR) repeat protein
VEPLSLAQLFERVRAAGERLSEEEAGLLFAAAVRLGSEQGAALHPARLLLLAGGALEVASREEGWDHPGYLAPELAQPDPPRRTEGRVQVFAAGALGFELLTGSPPEPGAALELHGPLADVIRVSLSPDRRERFGDLQQLSDAIEVIRPSAGREAQAQAALAELYEKAARWQAVFSWPAVASRLERLQQTAEQLGARLSAQEQALARAQAPQEGLPSRVADLEAAFHHLQKLHDEARDAQEQSAAALQQETASLGQSQAVLKSALKRVEAGVDEAERHLAERETREALAAMQRPRSPRLAGLAVALTGGLAGAAAMAAFFLVGPGKEQLQPRAAAAPASVAAAPAAAPSPTPAEAAKPQMGKEAVTNPEPAQAALDAGAALAEAPAAASDAGPALQVQQEPKPAGAPAASKGNDAVTEAAKGAGQVSPQRMARAVALSQVSRGDSALERGRADEAIQQFRRAIDSDPDLPEGHRGLGMACAMRNLDAEALREYERYLILAPAAPDKGDIERAMTELRSRSKLSP